jgi:hypothetical protein
VINLKVPVPAAASIVPLVTLNLRASRAIVADTLKVSGPFTEQTTLKSESPSLSSSPGVAVRASCRAERRDET